VSLLDRFRKPPAPEPRIHIPAISIPVINVDRMGSEPYRNSTLRRRPTTSTPHATPPIAGMWVRYGDRTGIITDLTAGDTYTVMIVDGIGENDHQVRANGSELRQAYFEEIPPARRPELEHAVTFGYHPRPK
jgi:hypothetical protein